MISIGQLTAFGELVRPNTGKAGNVSPNSPSHPTGASHRMFLSWLGHYTAATLSRQPLLSRRLGALGEGQLVSDEPLVGQGACRCCSSRIFGRPPSVNGATSTLQAGLLRSRTSSDCTMSLLKRRTQGGKMINIWQPSTPLSVRRSRETSLRSFPKKHNALPATCCSEGKYPSLRPMADSISYPFPSTRSQISWSYLAYITAVTRPNSPELILAPLLTPSVKTPYQVSGGALSK